jgi:hypothetical protein
MLVTVSAIVYPLLEQNDRDFAQSKGFRAVPENQTLTDVLEQQEAGPVIRERITNRRCEANENGPRFQGARAGSMGWHGAGSENGKETRARSPSASTNVPAPSRINWVTGRSLHTCTVLKSRESSTSVDANVA